MSLDAFNPHPDSIYAQRERKYESHSFKQAGEQLNKLEWKPKLFGHAIVSWCSELEAINLEKIGLTRSEWSYGYTTDSTPEYITVKSKSALGKLASAGVEFPGFEKYLPKLNKQDSYQESLTALATDIIEGESPADIALRRKEAAIAGLAAGHKVDKVQLDISKTETSADAIKNGQAVPALAQNEEKKIEIKPSTIVKYAVVTALFAGAALLPKSCHSDNTQNSGHNAAAGKSR